MRSARVATSLLATAAITLGLAGAAAGGNGHGKGHKDPGPPVADPAGVIDLPAGYSYDVLARDCVDQVTSTESGGTFPMPAGRSMTPAGSATGGPGSLWPLP